MHHVAHSVVCKNNQVYNDDILHKTSSTMVEYSEICQELYIKTHNSTIIKHIYLDYGRMLRKSQIMLNKKMHSNLTCFRNLDKWRYRRSIIVLCNAVKDSKIVFCIICYPQVPTSYVGCNLYLVFNLSSILEPIIPDDKGMFYQKDFFLTKQY